MTVALDAAPAPLAEPIPGARLDFHRLWLPFVLPSFNDMERAARRWAPGGGNAYAEMKQAFQALIVGRINRHKLPRLLPGVAFLFHWMERDQRRDPLDIRAGAKFVLDALCEPDRDRDRQYRAGVIHCDGHHCVVRSGVRDRWSFDADEPGVEVLIYGAMR